MYDLSEELKEKGNQITLCKVPAYTSISGKNSHKDAKESTTIVVEYHKQTEYNLSTWISKNAEL